ncbi:hypothetical protein ACXU4B_17380 [Dyella soli]|uniref:Uncharacterized protein n=1 Tax=Dyella soli TaxID=522319 RepID=A0A4R0YJQ9_9GAMM|nr:hypothetical protein [Dyella soli]TCI06429.1 hypothetical protein EZM97_33635 [Dyella soli]
MSPSRGCAGVRGEHGQRLATGDYGLRLSQQNLTRYFLTQQLPLAAWSLLRTWQELHAEPDPSFRASLQAYAWKPLDWILGSHPYHRSMLMGSGHRNARYMCLESHTYIHAADAIINGITSGPSHEDGIAFDLGYAQAGKDEDWRWTGQWLPRAAWYVLAINFPHD